MGAIRSTNTNYPGINSDFTTKNLSDNVVTFNFNGHNVTFSSQDVEFLLKFKSVVASKAALQQQFINAAPTESKLEQQYNELSAIKADEAKFSKLSPEQKIQLDLNIAETKTALKNIQVDTVLNQISQKPQERDAITKDFDRNVAKAEALSALLTQRIAQFFVVLTQQPQSQQKAGTNNSLDSSQQQATGLPTNAMRPEKESTQQDKISEQHKILAKTVEEQIANRHEEKVREEIQKIEEKFAADRKKEVNG